MFVIEYFSCILRDLFMRYYELFDIWLETERARSRRISFYDISRSINEKFGKIPLYFVWKNPSLGIFEILVEGVCIFSIDLDFCKKRKGDSEMEFAGTFYGFIGFGLLVGKLITWETKYDEIIMRIGIPESFQIFELSWESALCRCIDDKDNLSFEAFEWGDFSTRFRKWDIKKCCHR